MIKLLLVIFLFLAATVWCYYMTWMPGKSYNGPMPQLTAAERQIAHNLQQIVTTLATTIGPRHIHVPEKLAAAVDYISTTLQSLGYNVVKQEVIVENVPCFNIEVEKMGTELPEEIIIIGAHYDSIEYDDCPAANDNGSGVAATLELARLFAPRTVDRTVRFVFFVNEEPPHFYTKNMGSWFYTKRSKARKENIIAMFSLETIGYYSDAPKSQRYPFPFNFFYPHTGNFIGFVSNVSSGSLTRRSIASFRQHTQFPSEGGAIWSIIPGVSWSDQWAFWQHGYQAVMITDTAPFRYPYYHTRYDTADKLDYYRMAIVIAGLTKVMLDIATVQ